MEVSGERFTFLAHLEVSIHAQKIFRAGLWHDSSPVTGSMTHFILEKPVISLPFCPSILGAVLWTFVSNTSLAKLVFLSAHGSCFLFYFLASHPDRYYFSVYTTCLMHYRQSPVKLWAQSMLLSRYLIPRYWEVNIPSQGPAFQGMPLGCDLTF